MKGAIEDCIFSVLYVAEERNNLHVQSIQTNQRNK